jgi:hypothetical protein
MRLWRRSRRERLILREVSSRKDESSGEEEQSGSCASGGLFAPARQQPDLLPTSSLHSYRDSCAGTEVAVATIAPDASIDSILHSFWPTHVPVHAVPRRRPPRDRRSRRHLLQQQVRGWRHC